MIPLWDTRFELKPGTWVFVPTIETTKLGKDIKHAIEHVWVPPAYYFHLRSGGHVKALEAHLGNTIFAHLDIQDFFGSINKSRVTRCVKDLFGYEEGRRIANISTVVHPDERRMILPFGFVQSPILASLCLYKSALGSCLENLTDKCGIVVSVYVDDIILSCNDLDVLSEALVNIKRATDRAGFRLNAAKEEGPSSTVTAFNIKLTHKALEITPDRLADFVEAFNNSSNERIREGIRSYVSSVSSTQASSL